MDSFVAIIAFLSLLLLWSVLTSRFRKALRQRRRIQKNDSTTRSEARLKQQNRGRGTVPEPIPSTPGQCLACGTENDPFYTFCSNCVTPLLGR